MQATSTRHDGIVEQTIAALQRTLDERTEERDLARQELHRRMLRAAHIPGADSHALITRLSSVVAELQRVAEELEGRNTALAEANWNLERRVEERTAALRSAMEARREDEDRFRTVADRVPQLVWTSKPEGHWTYANQRWKAYTGQSDGEPLDMGWLEAVHPDDRERTMQAWHQASVSNTPMLVELRLLQADGTPRWFELQAMPPPAGSGVPWVGSCSDIHARKLSQAAMEDTQAALERELALRRQELEDTEARFLAYFDISTEALFTATALSDGDFLLDRINTPFEQTTGLSADAFSGSHLADLLPDAADAFEANFRHALERGEPHSFDVVVRLPVGQRNLRVALVPTHPRGDGALPSSMPRALLGSVQAVSNA